VSDLAWQQNTYPLTPMNDPKPVHEILRRLTLQQVIDELEQRNPDVCVMAPYYEGDRPRYFQITEKNKKALLEMLKSNSDRADIESYFYIDFDLDLILDPYSKP
jgi:hypothetical protein